MEAHPSHFEPNYVVATIIVVTTITLVTTITVVTAKIVVTVIVATTRGVLSGKCGHCDHLFFVVATINVVKTIYGATLIEF